VIRLENMAKPPAMSVYVVFQQVGESDEKVVSSIRTENHDPRAMLIMVTFVEPRDNSLTLRKVKA
jgi:hypothetical protein